MLKMMMMTAALLSVGMASNAQANPDNDDFYCEERGLGEYFYCKPPKKEEVEEEPVVTAPPPEAEPPLKDPVIADLEAFQVQLDDARKIAVWNPTKENVRHFMEMQIVMADRAEEFAGVFRRLGWQEPELSYNVKDPVNRAGLQTFRANVRMAKSRHMKGLSDRYGIYYFYAKNCAACEVFSPILAMFTDIHNLKVIAVSMDGGPNTHFADWRPDNGIATGLGLKTTLTPAVVLYDSYTDETVPVSFGVVSVEELEDRIFELTDGEATGYLGGEQ